MRGATSVALEATGSVEIVETAAADEISTRLLCTAGGTRIALVARATSLMMTTGMRVLRLGWRAMATQSRQERSPGEMIEPDEYYSTNS